MIVYNVTMKVDPAIEFEWIQWQKEEHIPEIMATQLFTDYKFFRLMEQDNTEGITYVIQYFSPTLQNYQEYIGTYAPFLREKAMKKWGQRFIAFRTVMELVN